MTMTEEMMDAIEKDLVFLATASKERIPNVVPIGMARPIDYEKILIADNYMKKPVRILKKTLMYQLLLKMHKKIHIKSRVPLKYSDQVSISKK